MLFSHIYLVINKLELEIRIEGEQSRPDESNIKRGHDYWPEMALQRKQSILGPSCVINKWVIGCRSVSHGPNIRYEPDGRESNSPEAFKNSCSSRLLSRVK